MGDMKRPTDMTSLIEGLKSKDNGVCGQAAFDVANSAVKGTDISEAFPLLDKLLLHTEDYVRQNAAWAFSQAAFSGKDISFAFPNLIKCLEDKELEVRQFATQAFANAGSYNPSSYSKAMPLLVKCLNDADETTRTQACWAVQYYAQENVANSKEVSALAKKYAVNLDNPELKVLKEACDRI